MRRALFLALCLAACGQEAPPQPAKAERKLPQRAPAPPATPETQERDVEAGAGAAATLKRYYALIEKGDLDGAWEMRSGDHAGRERFLANFQAYESYRATVGTPSRTVAAEGWEYVEVPVMIYGAFRGGKGFGNSGSVTLRRAAGARDATVRERNWHIYTG